MKKIKILNILMVVEDNYPHDTRVKQEIDKLINEGHKITIIAIKGKDQEKVECGKGIKVYRVPKVEFFEKSGPDDLISNNFQSKLFLYKQYIGYTLEYFYFTFCSFMLAVYIIIFNKIDVLHTHNPPDTLVIIGIMFKLFGKKYIYDHHDLAPDLFLEKFNNRKNLIFKVLLFFEKISCKFADIVIATNETYSQIEKKRSGISEKKIFIVRNGPDTNRIKRVEPIQSIYENGKIKLGYLGEINYQDGVDNIIKIVNEIVNNYKIDDILLIVVGDGDYLPQIKKLVVKYKMQDYVFFTGYLTDNETLNKYLSSVDIFIDAAPFSFLNNSSTFVKHMEYMIYGKPIVSYSLKENAYSLKNAGVLVKSFNNKLMAKEIVSLIHDKKRCEELGNYAEERVKDLTWDKVSINLLRAYTYLT